MKILQIQIKNNSGIVSYICIKFCSLRHPCEIFFCETYLVSLEVMGLQLVYAWEQLLAHHAGVGATNLILQFIRYCTIVETHINI